MSCEAERLSSPAGNGAQRNATECDDLCTPGMCVNLWGESPLYVNPVNVFNTLTKILAEGKGVSVRKGLKKARVQSYEPTNRKSI
jgi:hypothetical protein